MASSDPRDELEFTLPAQTTAETAAAEAAARGFDEDFLAAPVTLPVLGREAACDAVEVEGSVVIPYTHFSLSQSTSRRFARWVAWNIDGSGMQRLSRVGIDFRYDPKVPREYQAGDDLYAANDLDRGHLARRSDLLWGSRAEAQQANEDSFFFTNIAPQMANFNQSGRSGVWGELEDALFAQVDVDDLRVSVVAGPVLTDSDREYRGFQIPQEYYKIVYYVVDGELRAQAFVLAQELTGLDVLDFPEFVTYQVPLTDVESRTGITFAKAAAVEAGGSAPRVDGARALESTAQISW